MIEGEHTIIGKLPRERLNQIASRKLAALGVPVRLGADRESLEGELVFTGRIAHPATGQPMTRARFLVEGHDRLRFLDPPLAGLGAVDFLRHDRVAALEQAIATALQEALAGLEDAAARLRAVPLEAVVDRERLVVRAVVQTSGHAFEVIGAGGRLRVSRVAPVGGRPFEVDPAFPALELDGLAGPGRLERFLVDALPRMAPGPGSLPTPGAVGGEIAATPPPRTALTLAALAAAFGADAMLSPGAQVELVQEFEQGGTRYRVVATREMGSRFRGRVIGPSGDLWSEPFDLASFPGAREILARALGLEVGAGAPPPARPAGAGGPSTHVQPRAGEVWVMNVVVEEDGPVEVRYVGTDIDGRPYGAARVLKRPDFEAVFTRGPGGWRLLVQLDQVAEGAVIYRQLDRARQPLGAPRRMAAAILVANFVPEASTR